MERASSVTSADRYIGSLIATFRTMDRAASLLAIAALMGAALWNGYPLVYSDTSSYLGSGFALDTLVDRPITYGLFIRISSLNGLTLWTTIVAQCALLWWTISITMHWCGIEDRRSRMAVILMICILTGLPFVSGQLITDIFTPILVLALLNVLFNEGLSRVERVGMHMLFTTAFAMHMSHLLLTPVLLLVMLAIASISGSPAIPRGRVAIVILLISIGTTPMGVSIAKSKHVFFIARMAEEGILQRYLEKHCPDPELLLCDARPIAPSADAFLWAADSPLHAYPDWGGSEKEFSRIIRGSFIDPELIAMHFIGALRSSGKQLFRSDIADGMGVFGPGTTLYSRLGRYVPQDLNAYINSRQMARWITGDQLRALILVHRSSLIASVALIVFLLLRRRTSARTPERIRILALVLASAYVLNAAVNASLATVADRFGAKLAWALPFVGLIILYDLIRDIRSTMINPSS